MAWYDDVAKCLRLLADAFDGRSSAIMVEEKPTLSLMGVEALVHVALPLQKLLAQKATLQDMEQLARAALDEIALAVPETAAAIRNLELASSLLMFLIGAARASPFKIEPGFPPWLPPGLGQSPFRSR